MIDGVTGFDIDEGVWTPSDAREVCEAVQWAVAHEQTVEIVGGGSKRSLGRPMRTDHRLHLAGVSGVVDSAPGELVLTARAGTPLADIESLLEANQQMLAFEPPDWSGLLGPGRPTLGGTVACNGAGPRRVRAGAARDHFLGFAAVNGWGDAWKAGGKVVKNVTGYDMCKLQAGAFGTLSVLTELSVRVMPKPETVATVVLDGLNEADAIVAMTRALNTPHEVSAAAHVPSTGVTALRVEGHTPSVAFRANSLERMFGSSRRLNAAESLLFWSEVGGVVGLLETSGRVVWRLCPTPSEAARVVTDIRRSFRSASVLYDWGGGLVWLGLEPTGDAGAAVVRAAVGTGHATLFAAPEATRDIVPVFGREPAPLAALAARVKRSFDPHGVLNPGRMQESR